MVNLMHSASHTMEHNMIKITLGETDIRRAITAHLDNMGINVEHYNVDMEFAMERKPKNLVVSLILTEAAKVKSQTEEPVSEDFFGN